MTDCISVDDKEYTEELEYKMQLEEKLLNEAIELGP